MSMSMTGIGTDRRTDGVDSSDNGDSSRSRDFS